MQPKTKRALAISLPIVFAVIVVGVLAFLAVHFNWFKKPNKNASTKNTKHAAPVPAAVTIPTQPALLSTAAVAIFMPFYSGAEFLQQAVKSVLSQTHLDWELIIAVNGHAMDSPEYALAHTLAQTDPRIVVQHYNVDPGIKNKKSFVLNKMTETCQRKVVALLDADDVWLPTKLEEQMRVWNTGKYDVVGTKCLYLSKHGDDWATSEGPNIPTEQLPEKYNLITDGNPIINSSCLLRIEDCYWYETWMAEDYDLWIRLHNLKKKIYNIPQALVQHRVHAASFFNGKIGDDVAALQNHWRPPITRPPTTVVSAYYPMKSKRPAATYMDWATHIMSLQWYMVLFLPPECVEDFKRLKTSNHKKLFIITKRFDELEFGSPEWMAIWRHQHTLDSEASIHSPELYAVWAQKSGCLHEAMKINPFGSDVFVWHDAGGVRSKPQADNMATFPSPKKLYSLHPNRFPLLLVSPFKPGDEHLDQIDGLPKQSVLEEIHFGGGILPAFKHTYHIWAKAYRHTLEKMRKAGRFIGKDQTVFNAMYLMYPYLFTVIQSPNTNDWYYLQHYFSD
jgi:glycosyltransferase involved in cell wall biosynthesis